MSDTRTPSYGRVDRDYALRLASTPPEDDGPIWMVNLMSYRDAAVYDGEESGISGREADDRYAPLDVLAEIGAEVVFVGDVEDQLLGDSPRWDRIAVVKYPTRRSFIEMQSRPDFQDKHVHKEAGMADHAALVAVPHGVQIAAWFGVEGTIVGDGREWHEARFNRFPSKAAFMAVVMDPDRLAAQADHREVAIADTYTLVIRPTIDRIEESISRTA